MKCKFCEKEFSSERKLKIHVTKMHGAEVPKEDKSSFLMNLNTVELNSWKDRAKSLNYDSLTSYLRDVVNKDILGLVPKETEFAKIKKEKEKLESDIEKIKSNILDKLEWSLLAREEKIASKIKKFKLDEKVKVMTDDYFESPDFKRRAKEMIDEDEKNRAIEKEWSEMTDEEVEKAKFLMLNEDLELPTAIIRVKKSKPVSSRFTEVFSK
jgi:hypothetical protein